MARGRSKLLDAKDQLLDFSGITRGALEAVVNNLVREGVVSREAVQQQLDKVRQSTGQRVVSAVCSSRGPEIIVRSPQTVLRTKLEEDYVRQVEDFRSIGLQNELMPPRLQIIDALTPEVLAKALCMEKLGKGVMIKGLLVSDCPLESKIRHVDQSLKKITSREWHQSVIYRLEDMNLWNGGQEWVREDWRYKLVQGESEVQDDRNIQGNNYRKAKAWLAKIQNAGFEMLSGAGVYLNFVRQSIVEGEIADTKTVTLLNAKNLKMSSPPPPRVSYDVAFGHWNGDAAFLGGLDPNGTDARLRGRAMLDVELVKV